MPPDGPGPAVRWSVTSDGHTGSHVGLEITGTETGRLDSGSELEAAAPGAGAIANSESRDLEAFDGDSNITRYETHTVAQQCRY